MRSHYAAVTFVLACLLSVSYAHAGDPSVGETNLATIEETTTGKEGRAALKMDIADFTQAPTGVRQADQDLTLIRRITMPAEISHPFQLLEDKREDIGFAKQLLAQAADGLVFFLL